MSYANLSNMLSELGISVNRITIYLWFIGLVAKTKIFLRCLSEHLISSINTKNIEEFANEGGSLLYP